MQSVDDFLYTSEQHFIIPFFVFVLDELDHLPWTRLPATNSTTRHQLDPAGINSLAHS
jgi:hypothetical protein